MAIFLVILTLLVLLYFMAMRYSYGFDAKGKRNLRENTLFVLAHPDDECM
jgi:hypothetical protein